MAGIGATSSSVRIALNDRFLLYEQPLDIAAVAFRSCPTSDIRVGQRSSCWKSTHLAGPLSATLLDDLIGLRQQDLGHGEPQRGSGLEIVSATVQLMVDPVPFHSRRSTRRRQREAG